jgi:hypothetical protein
LWHSVDWCLEGSYCLHIQGQAVWPWRWMNYEESRNAAPTAQKTEYLCYRDQPLSVVQWNCRCSLGKPYEKQTNKHTRARTHTVYMPYVAFRNDAVWYMLEPLFFKGLIIL